LRKLVDEVEERHRAHCLVAAWSRKNTQALLVEPRVVADLDRIEPVGTDRAGGPEVHELQISG
jgi:hypothetical protein